MKPFGDIDGEDGAPGYINVVVTLQKTHHAIAHNTLEFWIELPAALDSK